MKKIELLDNETFTIKGVYGETYVFDGGTLFVDSSGVSRKAVVLKSLRTEKGAEEWLRTAGRSYSGAQVFDTETLKSFDGRVVTLKSMTSGDEEDEFDATLPFHVTMTEGDEDDDSPMDDEMSSSDEEMDSLDREPGEVEELMEDEEQEQEMTMTQLAQVLHDAKKIYNLVKDEEHLEPWMQAKLVKVAEYMSVLAEKLEHDDGDIPDDSVVDEFESNFDMDDETGSEDDGMEDAATMPEMGTDVKDEKKAAFADAAMMSANSYKSADEDFTGKVFKSLHAARQWNRFENPDKERYYIDIMREKDARKGFSKSTGLNAKYVVRDRWDEEDVAIKGAYGNKKMMSKKATQTAPVKKIDPETLRVAAITNPKG